MSDNDLLDLAESIFAGGDGAGTGLDTGLWKTLEETGLARLTLPESAGGSGGTLTDAAAVLQAAGAHTARELASGEAALRWPLQFMVVSSVGFVCLQIYWFSLFVRISLAQRRRERRRAR